MTTRCVIDRKIGIRSGSRFEPQGHGAVNLNNATAIVRSPASDVRPATRVHYILPADPLLIRSHVMNRIAVSMVALSLVIAAVGQTAWANGGPFVVKYPSGDPAAKGVLARLDPSLEPMRETRLRVIKEDLTVTFGVADFRMDDTTYPPLATVTAEYTIENPTDDPITVDFGFPILRGIYTNPFSMRASPSVSVTLDGKRLKSTIISNSLIYGMLRQRARAVIDQAVAADEALNRLVETVRQGETTQRDPARAALQDHLTRVLMWTPQDAALMVEFASLDLGAARSHPADRDYIGHWIGGPDASKLLGENLGVLSAIGEQKATQFLAHLAGRFASDTAAGYETIFKAWGGDVREHVIDLTTGKVRPRELTVSDDALTAPQRGIGPFDPTIYARVDYLDPKAKINERERASCRAVLKNLPVVFTFAPMNLIHYESPFLAKSTRTLTVTYQQYAFQDTGEPASYQLAYVVHPASLWDRFGPINLEVLAPDGVTLAASVPVKRADTSAAPEVRGNIHGEKLTYATYHATIKKKTGELLLGINAAGWQRAVAPPKQEVSLNQADNADQLTSTEEATP